MEQKVNDAFLNEHTGFMKPQYFKITWKHEFLSIYYKTKIYVYTYTHLHILLQNYKIRAVEHLESSYMAWQKPDLTCRCCMESKSISRRWNRWVLEAIQL